MDLEKRSLKNGQKRQIERAKKGTARAKKGKHLCKVFKLNALRG